MKSLLPMALCLMLAAPAWGASKLEASRAAVQSLRKSMGEVRTRQMALRKELNQLAARIETLKAQRKNKLLTGGELDNALRRSQEISTTLTGLAQNLSRSEGRLEQEHQLLLGALSEELTALRAQFDRQTDRTQRQQLLEQMRTLRAEREQVRAALPASAIPALEAPAALEDPEDLLEQADALRDREEKVRRELKALEARIVERREERELDRRMNEFLSEDSLFDEQDRRFRLQRDIQVRAGAPAAASSDTFNSASSQEAAAPTGNNLGMGPQSLPPPAPRDVNQSEKAAGESVINRTARASDARPIVGTSPRGVESVSGDDLEQLEVEQARLKGLAEELKARAQQLEKKAQQLR